MLSLRNALQTQTRYESQDVLMALACAGVAVARRLALAHEEDAVEDLRTTLALLMALVVMAAGDVMSGMDLRDHHATLQKYQNGTLAKTLEVATDAARSDDWEDALACVHPGEVCQSVVWLINFDAHNASVDTLAKMGATFFRCSAAATAQSLFDNVAPGAFVSMSVGAALDPLRRQEQLESIVSAAESEAGQTILRDLQLSFLLPRDVVGVRRAVLLSRATNAEITRCHPSVLNSAHESALRGAVWEWSHSKSETVRISAVLAGLGVLLSSSDIRKEDAHAGRLALPFFETLPPQQSVPRLTLIESNGEWVCWRNVNGRVEVLVRRPGFDGFLDCVLVFTSMIK